MGSISGASGAKTTFSFRYETDNIGGTRVYREKLVKWPDGSEHKTEIFVDYIPYIDQKNMKKND